MRSSVLSVALEDMTEPHDLSAFILQLGRWRKSNSTDTSTSACDDIFCSQLSCFIYEQRLRGVDLKRSVFTKHDFDCIVSVITDGESAPYNADWLWDVILKLQSKNRNREQQSTQLGWIHNEWSKLQTLCACPQS